MAQIIRCPQCTRELQVPESLLGQLVRCPTCNVTFETADDGTVSSPAAPQVTAAPLEEEPSSAERPTQRPMPSRLRRDTEPHRGTLILVLGIMSIAVCALTGPFAWIMGQSDLNKIRAGRMDAAGEGNTNAGRICGIIGTLLFLFQLLLFAAVMAAALISAAASAPAGAPPPQQRAPVPARPPMRPAPPPIDDDDDREGRSSRHPPARGLYVRC